MAWAERPSRRGRVEPEERDIITTETYALIQETLTAQIAPNARLIEARRREGGPQGYSGSPLRYYDVTYERSGAWGETTLVTKEAPLVERRALAWLGERGLPVPFSHTRDLTTDAPVTVCMQHVGEEPPRDERATQAARALAAIHHAALGRGGELPWLPRADPAFFAGRLIDTCWRKPWRHALYGEGYTDWFGRRHAPVAPDPELQAAFAAATPALEDAAARFLRAMIALWAAGDALTLIHADFHGDHVRWRDGRAAVIDWEQARYGPLYIDLPNYFTRDDALLYRDALADLGHDIPRDRFLAGYAAADPYPGLKYFGIGLSNWRHGNPPRRPESVQYWIDMALKGASRGV